MTDVVQELVFEYIPGISMAKLEPDVDVSEQGAKWISSQVMEALRAIEAEKCLLHNVVHIGNVVLRDGSRSAVIIDFGQANVREPDEGWSSVVWGSPEDRRRMRNLLMKPEDGSWKQTVTPYEMSDPQYPLVFNKNVESLFHDFCRVIFEGVLDTDWERAREKVHQWRMRPGVRCRPVYDQDMTSSYDPSRNDATIFRVFLHINGRCRLSTSDVPAILHTVWFLVARLESKNDDALTRWPSLSYHPFLFLCSAFLAHAKLISIHYLNTIILRRF